MIQEEEFRLLIRLYVPNTVTKIRQKCLKVVTNEWLFFSNNVKFGTETYN